LSYLTAVNPLVDFELSPDGRLSFANAASAAGVAAPPSGGYRVRWARFDNDTGTATPIGETAIAPGERAVAPGPLPDGASAFVRVEVTSVAPAHAEWAPASASFRRTGSGWTLVGLSRLAP
jgi:hypothetical protein